MKLKLLLLTIKSILIINFSCLLIWFNVCTRWTILYWNGITMVHLIYIHSWFQGQNFQKYRLSCLRWKHYFKWHINIMSALKDCDWTIRTYVVEKRFTLDDYKNKMFIALITLKLVNISSNVFIYYNLLNWWYIKFINLYVDICVFIKIL